MASNIPQAAGVPGEWNTAPQWWNSGGAPRRYDASPDDVRWDGAVRHSYGYGAGEQATFRAVYAVESGQNVLYLQWRVFDDTSPDGGSDGVHVGFVTAGGNEYLFKLAAFQAPPPDATPRPADINSVQERIGGAGNWGTVSAPTWLTDSTYGWLAPAQSGVVGHNDWGIAMRVPILTGGVDFDGTGMKLPSPFKFFYAMIWDHGTVVGVTPFFWPRNSAITQPSGIITYPDPAQWDSVTIGGASGSGVSLAQLDIGTDNIDPNTHMLAPNEIDVKAPPAIQPTNVFHAYPVNGMDVDVDAGSLVATFRTANWGSQVPWSWQTAPGAQAWQDMFGGGHPNQNKIVKGTKGDSLANGAIMFNWTATEAEAPDWLPGGSKMSHQCMLVTLASPGKNYDFDNDSIYRNMDFVQTSAFDRIAEINLRGAKPARAGLFTRLPILRNETVYVTVVQSNMPKTTPVGHPIQPVNLRNIFTVGNPLAAGPVRAALPAIRFGSDMSHLPIDEPPPSIRELANAVASVRYHLVRSTAKRIDVNGKLRPVVEPMTSFGYFIQQSHAVSGWDVALGGSFAKVGPSMYKLAVPGGSVKPFATKIVGHEVLPPPQNRLPVIVAGPAGPIQSKIPILKTMPSIGSVLSGVIRR